MTHQQRLRLAALLATSLVACGVDVVLNASMGGSPNPVDNEAGLDGRTNDDGTITSDGGDNGDAPPPCPPSMSFDGDPLNCGACHHDCLGGQCAVGKCQPKVILSKIDAPVGIAIFGDRLYWASTAANTINFVTLMPDGTVGPATLLFGTPKPRYIAFAGQDIYWTVYDPLGTVLVRPITGGTITTLATNQYHPSGIAVIAGSLDVYWAEQYTDSLWLRSPNDGGVPTKISNGGLCFDEGIAYDTTSIYVAAPCEGIMRTNYAGKSVTNLSKVDAGDWPAGIALDGDQLYFTYSRSDTILQMPKAGGTAPILLAANQSQPMGIAVDAKAIYWANEVGKTIVRLAK